jgi:hypothetical protein
MSLSMKFAEAKLKADLSNYLDWSTHMKTYLTYYDCWGTTTNKPSETESDETKKEAAEKENNKAYLIVESQCEAETYRAYLVNCKSSAYKAWEALGKAYLGRIAISKPYTRKQLRLLRLENFKDMRTFIQEHRDLIRQYNKIANAQVPTTEEVDTNGLALRGKDKIAIAEAVDLICKNLSKD